MISHIDHHLLLILFEHWLMITFPSQTPLEVTQIFQTILSMKMPSPVKQVQQLHLTAILSQTFPSFPWHLLQVLLSENPSLFL